MRKQKYRVIICFVMVLSMAVLGTSQVIKASTVTKAEYTMKKDKVTYKDSDGIVRGTVYFQYPVIKGKSDAVKKINKTLKQASKEFMESENAKNLKEYTEADIEDKRFENSDENYYYKTICKVTYNDNSVISLHMKNCWYAGGVYNQEDYGYTFNLKSGKQLGIKDVISGDASSIKKKILAKGKKYLTENNKLDQNAYNIIKSYKLKDYKFYLTKGKVYICFSSYELERGTSWDIFSVSGKFK